MLILDHRSLNSTITMVLCETHIPSVINGMLLLRESNNDNRIALFKIRHIMTKVDSSIFFGIYAKGHHYKYQLSED